MTRQVSNDELAARATIKASAAPKDSRDARAWRQVSAALSVTGTQDSARAFLYSLTMPTLRDDALRRLNMIIAQTLEIAERERDQSGD